MAFDSLSSTPLKVSVCKLVSSRYPTHQRPESWDERRAGVDVVETLDGKVLKLWSDGQQSPPKEGWELMITENAPDGAYRWTLYGLGSAN